MTGSGVEVPGAAELTVVSHYRVVQKLTSGGMADIYLAEDLNLPRPIVLKLLPEARREDEVLQERLMREARAASVLSHPNIARIYDAGRDGGSLFIAMEYIDGETLEQRLTREAPSIEFITKIGVQLADALHEAHSHGIIHRDIKTSNVMLTRKDQVKVLDFGLAKFSNAEAGVDASTSWKTQSGLVIGTVPYMSPEQVRGEPADSRSDIFAFGVLMYELVTRRLPFEGTSIADTFYRIANKQPEPMARFNYDLPRELERIIRKCMEKDPARRYQSAADLLVDLRNFDRDRLVPSDSHSRVSDIILHVNRRRAMAWAGVLLLIALLTGLAMWGRPHARTAPVTSIAVLPFVNQGATGFEYVSGGLSDVLISDLARTTALRVLAGSTTERFAGRTPVEAGRALRVDAVLWGHVRRVGDRIVVTTELVRSRDGSLISGERFERAFADIPTLASSISQGVIHTLDLDVPAARGTGIEASEDAYRLYLRGRQEWNKRTPEGMRSAIELFREAVEMSPDFAAAYAGLADTYSLLERYASVPNAQSRDLAVAAAERAVALDPSLAEAHSSLASVRETYQWDWASAEAEYRKALALSPSYATAHHWYAMLLARQGRFAEALQEIRTARELDPLSPLIGSAEANIDYCRGDFQASIDAARSILRLAPDFHLARLQLALSMTMAGDSRGALREIRPIRDDDIQAAATEALASARAGDPGAAQAFLRTLESSGTRTGHEYAVAAVYVAVGDNVRAFSWLERAYENHSFWLAYLAVDPLFAPLHHDPRLRDLLRRVGLSRAE